MKLRIPSNAWIYVAKDFWDWLPLKRDLFNQYVSRMCTPMVGTVLYSLTIMFTITLCVVVLLTHILPQPGKNIHCSSILRKVSTSVTS